MSAALIAAAKAALRSMRDAVHWAETGKGRPPQQTCMFEIEALAAALSAAPEQAEPVAQPWIEGSPPFPQDQEWFIAITKYGERVVLRALDKTHTYKYTTADHTYMAADNVVRWMQFPDCEYLPPAAAPAPAPIAQQRNALDRFNKCGGYEGELPPERLRFFCSLAMSWQDWLDVEPFFDAVAATIAQPPEPDTVPVPVIVAWSGGASPYRFIRVRLDDTPTEYEYVPAAHPLTDEQIDTEIAVHIDPVATYRKLFAFARAIERAVLAAAGIGKEQQP